MIVVGAGCLGLSTALHLAEAGVGVAVLEADTPGSGASGRNTGFVVPSFVTPVGPDRVRAELGYVCAERLCRLVGGSGDLVFDLIRRKRMECDASRTGWLQPAPSRSGFEFLKIRCQEWAAHGKVLELLGREETIRLTGSGDYSGSLLDRSGGHVNPLKFTRSLAVAACSAGASVHVGARVRDLESEDSLWRVSSSRGVMKCRQVLLATNSLDSTLAPDVAKGQFPAVVSQIATTRLEASNRDTIIPDGQCVSDIRRDIMAYRWTPDGRLLTGGIGSPLLGSSRRLHESFLKRLNSTVAIKGHHDVEFAWNGAITITRSLLPRICELDRGVYAAVGCCGRGLALSTALGKDLATFIKTGDRNKSCVPVAEPISMPGRHLFRWLIPLLVPLNRMMDRPHSQRPKRRR